MKKQISRKAPKVIGSVALTALAAFGLARPITVAVDGRNVVFRGAQPMKMGDHVMVPLRGVFERMGANVDWQESSQTVLARRGATRVELRINDTNAYVNGTSMTVNYPAVVIDGSTMVPIRFISEALGAYVDWDETASLVSISTNGTSRNTRVYDNSNNGVTPQRTMLSVQPRGSVIPLKLDTNLNSSDAQVGDTFTATVDTNGSTDYFGLPQGTKVEGHVGFAQARNGDTPGALGLIYDRVVTKGGRKVPVEASLIGLDDKSVTNENGRIIARSLDKNKEDMKYVGIGAGAGAILAVVTKGNLITNTLIGGALGYLYNNVIGNRQTAKNVVLTRGTPIGMRLDQELTVRVPNYTVNDPSKS